MAKQGAILQAKRLLHAYSGKGGNPALDSLDLSFEAGTFTALCGPSGSGKTTLLLILGGMLRPGGGQVLVDGQDLYGLGPASRRAYRRARMGFAFQSMHLIPYLDALSNVALGDSREGARNRALERLVQLGLGERANHRPDQLSAGERQRVALARALASEPDILLADEPTGNLDPHCAENVARQLQAFHSQGGTLLLATHDATLAERAGSLVRLDQGRLV